jgi:hypothetical protein
MSPLFPERALRKRFHDRTPKASASGAARAVIEVFHGKRFLMNNRQKIRS